MRAMTRLAILFAPLLLAGCAAAPPVEATANPARAGIGQTVAVEGPKVTPLQVLEDSRCPKGVQCVWAGRVRIATRIDLGSGSVAREVTLGQPIHIADGELELVEVLPDKVADRTILPEDYRFGFRFAGGL
jgi:hypothetical protein